MGGISSLQPSYFVDFLLNFQTLQVVKLGLMTLERAVHVILAKRHILQHNGGIQCTRPSLSEDNQLDVAKL